MKRPAAALLSRQIPSKLLIWCAALLCGFSVLAIALGLQWLIYNDWMHGQGPVRVVGSLTAALLAFFFALRLQVSARERKLEMVRRFETIASMNDRIRNALQVIECATYATNPQATAPVRDAVNVIEDVLMEVIEEVHPQAPIPARNGASDQVKAIRG